MILSAFRDVVEAWASDGYYADIRYIARKSSDVLVVWEALIILNPIPPNLDNSFQVDAGGFVAGQIHVVLDGALHFRRILSEAAQGQILINGVHASIPIASGLDYYSELASRDSWFNVIHLQVNGEKTPVLSSIELAQVDSALRSASIPFDGLSDLVSFLSLKPPGTSAAAAAIQVRVNPQIDLISDACHLSNDKLKLVLKAVRTVDLSKFQLAVRSFPGKDFSGRMQVASSIIWELVDNSLLSGSTEIELPNSDQAIAMLTHGGATIRRQWFIDPQKARNARLLAIQHFDKDLRMLKNAALKSNDAPQFEKAIACLLFAMGFDPAIQIESDAPDIIVSTPSGRILLVECTLRTSDLATKVGKLIDRRMALLKALNSSNHSADVFSALVCRVPRDQLAADPEELRKQNVLLVTETEIESAFMRLRFPGNADEMLESAFRR